MFSVRKNCRRYEWTKVEVEELWTDLLEYFDGNYEEGFDINQIILYKIDSNDNGTFYEVHDGQQRLITLCLLFAAIRDRFTEIASNSSLSDEDRASAMEEADEVTKWLVPPKPKRYAEVLRVQLRQSDSVAFDHILKGNVSIDQIPPSPSESTADKHIRDHFEFFSGQLAKFELDKLCKVLDGLKEQVFLIIAIPGSPQIARSLVRNQNKGKDLEVVDEFKATVVFDSTLSEREQDELLERWDKLMLPDEVGRKLVTEACLLLAQAELGRRGKKNDVKLLADYWSAMRAKGIGPVAFFDEHVSRAAHLLKGFSVAGGGNPMRSARFLNTMLDANSACERGVADQGGAGALGEQAGQPRVAQPKAELQAEQ